MAQPESLHYVLTKMPHGSARIVTVCVNAESYLYEARQEIEEVGYQTQNSLHNNPDTMCHEIWT